MMTNSDLVVLEKIQKTIKECIKKPEAFLSIQENLSENLKKSTKDLYDLAVKRKSFQSSKSEALPKLIIKGFDEEQIWQQLELKNNEEFSKISLGNISKTLASKKSWTLPLQINIEDSLQKSEESLNESNEEDEEEKYNEEKWSQQESEDDIIHDNSKRKEKSTSNSSKKRKRTSEVDDQFFKLDDLDKFLQKEDQKEMKKNKEQNDDSFDEDNESIDLFNNFSDSDDNEGEDQKIKSGKSVKFADFFDNPESDDDDQQETSKETEDDNENDYQEDQDLDDKDDDSKFNQNDLVKEKKVKFNLLSHLEGPDSGNESSSDEEDKDRNSFKKRQERLKKRIQALEEEAISEKPWQLKGETSASSRPKDSLLEEFVEFDSVTRPAPVMTEQTTMKLEDIIRARIKDKAWDDVEKKFKPVETPMEYKKKLVMNQEKSKESLAQIYENEYVKQREALTTEDKNEQDKEEPPEHIEIKEKMYSLFKMLDALSNFHYTPKPAKPEVKIVSNIPAINMEEATPVATSDATLLAPEEIQSKPKGDLIGKSERTKTDKKRERRKKKAKQHIHANESKKLKQGHAQKKELKNKIKGRNIINASESSNGKSIKSSTAFFAQLQDQVESSIKAKTSSNTIKKNKNTVSAVKLKL